jgi:uncharacterized membrane protein
MIIIIDILLFKSSQHETKQKTIHFSTMTSLFILIFNIFFSNIKQQQQHQKSFYKI